MNTFYNFDILAAWEMCGLVYYNSSSPTLTGNKESGYTSSRLRTMVYDSSRCVFVRTKRADWKSTKEYFLFMPLSKTC